MRPFLLGLVILGIILSITYLELIKPLRNSVDVKTAEIPVEKSFTKKEQSLKTSVDNIIQEKVKKYSRAKEITDPQGFINSEPLKIKDLVGKRIILVDFWTYSCINCQRTTPYLNAWYEKYHDKGLEIIGIHTPEFEFEKKYENVQSATRKFGIKYPVVLDNNYGTWNAYGNRYWPRKYLIDIDGFIVYDHIGEGGYDETEIKIQELLGEKMTRLGEPPHLCVRCGGEQGQITKEISKPADVVEVDFSEQRSPEIYFGANRNTYLGNGQSGVLGTQKLSESIGIKTNILYLTGDWNFSTEYAENKSVNAKIIFRYQGKNVYMVASADQFVKAKILKDGKILESEAGEDVLKDGSSSVTFKEDRLYKLIQDKNYGEHTLEIIIEKPGLKVFTFTFG